MPNAPSIRALLAIAAHLLLAACAPAASFYVDSHAGNDRSDGLSPGHAWKTLDPVNAHTFRPGDRLLFKAGSQFEGRLSVSGSGDLAHPVVVDMYERGPLPRIDAGGNFPEAVLLRNVEFWQVQNLEVTNLGPTRSPRRAGVRVLADQAGAVRHVYLRNLFVHDVNGDLHKSREGCGIYLECAGDRASHFEDLRVERCHLARTDRNGICQRAVGGLRSRGVLIRENLLEDIGGDGIKVWGSDGAVVERNVIRGGRTRCPDAAAGIWPWDSDDTIIQYNEVSGMKGTTDGQAFDADYRCRRTTIQYNYSHDNEGGFLLVCTPGNSYCEDSVVRYNVSRNDGVEPGRVIQFGGGARHTRVYNNTIYVSRKQNLPLVTFNEWNKGWASDTLFANNLFYLEGVVTYRLGSSRGTVFDHNLYCGLHPVDPHDAHPLTGPPPLRDAGTGGDGFSSLSGYRWTGPAVTGVTIPDNGGHDFFGQPVPAAGPPGVGACQPAK